MHLTKRKIDSFEYEGQNGSRDVRWDDRLPGFGVRIYPNGKRSFVLSYRCHGRKRLMVLGPYGVLTLEQARDKPLLNGHGVPRIVEADSQTTRRARCKTSSMPRLGNECSANR